MRGKRIAELETECANLKEILASVQWKARIGAEGEYWACPECGSISPDDPDFGGGDHAPDCRIGIALRK